MPTQCTQPYRILEHTADAGIAAHGATLAEAFAHAAQGMYALMVDPATIRDAEVRDVTASASDREKLLVAWLLELLFLTDTEGLLFRRFSVQIDNESVLHARAFGEPLDHDRHTQRVAVKAVTYHMLSVEESPNGYDVQVLFDI